MKQKLLSVAKFFTNIPGFRYYGKKIFGNIYKKYSIQYRDNKLRPRVEAYKKHGLEAIKLFHDCMEKNGFKYTLAFGSMLGAIREKGFIKHDLDLDTYMWAEDFSSVIIDNLCKMGFCRVSTNIIADGQYGIEETVGYKGVNIDIFVVFKDEKGMPYCCDFVFRKGMKKSERLPRKISMPISKDRLKVKFEDTELYVPANAEELCEFRYGPNYMIPDSNWNWVSATNSLIEWSDMKDQTLHIDY